VDLLHTPFNFGLPLRSSCPRVMTLHDVIDYSYYGRRSSARQRITPAALRSGLSMWIARKAADQFITVSEHARGDLIRYLYVSPSKITVTYEAADPSFHGRVTGSARAAVCSKYSLTKPYVLYVGGWEERKNVPFLLRAFAAAKLANVDLTLVGGREDQMLVVRRLAESLGIAARLRLLGIVNDNDLRAIYRGALCFVYASEYEGFGLQLCEAMAVGCPVFAARSTSLPEILGDGGECFSLEHHAELAALLQRVEQEQEFRAALVSRAEHRGKEFSWRRTAEETLRVYQCASAA
jgi:glycosyltransferase involved in cell wall biosynthesis